MPQSLYGYNRRLRCSTIQQKLTNEGSIRARGKNLSQASLIIDFPVRIKPECDALFLDIGANNIAQLESVRPSVILLLAKYLFTRSMRSNAT